ncbi:MAG: LPS export ABC transporter periplasmic protein LptC [Treponema sp.]|nr:LPS export ABC transporter periplasmic protein LptC [Treponema sp.]
MGKGVSAGAVRKGSFFRRPVKFPIALLFFLFLSCSFDYGNKEEAERVLPDLIMENVDYVRVRGGEPSVRFQAELAERYENKQLMNLKKLVFEQYEDKDTINSSGSAGNAHIELDSGNISFTEDVFISVDSEDITIQTSELKWKDKEKQLSGSPANSVDINRSDGTSFSGVGFFADARYWTWSFDSGVSGVYVEEDDKEEAADGDEAEDEDEGSFMDESQSGSFLEE